MKDSTTRAGRVTEILRKAVNMEKQTLKQTCLVCGPGVACAGHPAKKRRVKIPTEKKHVPQGECPACVCISKARHTKGRHFLQSPSEIKEALKVGPVFCFLNKNNKRGLPWDRPFNVRGAGVRYEGFSVELLEGWFYRAEVGEVWMNADTRIKLAA